MGERCAFYMAQEHELCQLAVREVAQKFPHPPVCPCIGISMLSISESIGHVDILKSGFFILGTFNVLFETLDIHFVNSWL